MQRKKSMKKILGGVIVAGLLSMNLGITTSYAEDVNIAIKSTPNIDVVLTVGNTNWNPSSFTNDLKSRLSGYGIDASKVSVQAVEAKELTAEDTFNWKIYDHLNYQEPYGSSRYNHIVNNGKDITFYGYTLPAYKDFVFMPNDNPGKKTFTFTVNESVTDWHTLEGAGFLFNSYIDANNRLYGYVVLFGQNNIILDELNGVDVDTFRNGTYNTVASAGRQVATFPRLGVSSHNVKIEVTPDKIDMWDNNQKMIDGYSLPNKFGNGFGPLASYVSHGCSVISYFTFQNIKMETLNVKQFKDVIQQPAWRDSSERFVVNLEDNIVPDFNNTQYSGEILMRLINENISYVSLGTSQNKAQAQNFIARNNGNGTYIDNGDYNTAMNQLAKYIEDQLPTEDNSSQYVLVNEPVNISVSPVSLMTNTQTAEYPQGRWRIDHDYSYFENDLGQASWAGQWQKDLKMVFDKPGRYELWFGDKHPNPQYIYVHRKPIADFNLNVVAGTNSFSVVTNDRSYDPDAQSTADKGISQKEWKWKETNSDSWNVGQIPSSLPLGKDYIVQLSVKDKQGVWSQPKARYITSANIVTKPVADFEIPSTVSRYENLNINNSSYDPAGRPITQYTWTVYNNGKSVYSGNTPIANFNTLGAGNYEIGLKVLNNAGLWSEEFRRQVAVTEDTSKPEAIFNLTHQDWTSSDVNATITFRDEGGSGFNNQRYAISNSIVPPTSGWSTWSTETQRTVTVSNEGKWYIHIEAKDNAGNTLQQSMGEYQIDKTKPTPPTVNISGNNLTVVPGTDINLLNTVYQINEGQWLSYEKPVVLNDGKYSVKVKSVDKAGNQSDEISLTKIVVVSVSQLVQFAEEHPSRKSVDEAMNSVDLLPDSQEKSDLKNRLDKINSDLLIYYSIKNGLLEIGSALESGKYSKETIPSMKEEISNLQSKLDSLPKTFDKTNLQKEIDYLTKKLQLIESIIKTKGNEVVDIDLDELQKQLDDLEDGELKDQLQNELDYAKNLKDAIQAVELAEQTRSENQIEIAKNLVDKLSDEKVKKELLDRLEKIEKEIVNIDIDPVKSIDAIKNSTVKKLLLNVESYINIAEKFKTRATIVNAISKVDGVSQEIRSNPAYKGIMQNFDSRVNKLKTEFNGGVQDQVDEQALKKATSYVEYYEKYRSSFYKSKAEEYVGLLPDGQIKEDLQARIGAVNKK